MPEVSVGRCDKRPCVCWPVPCVCVACNRSTVIRKSYRTLRLTMKLQTQTCQRHAGAQRALLAAPALPTRPLPFCGNVQSSALRQREHRTLPGTCGPRGLGLATRVAQVRLSERTSRSAARGCNLAPQYHTYQQTALGMELRPDRRSLERARTRLVLSAAVPASSAHKTCSPVFEHCCRTVTAQVERPVVTESKPPATQTEPAQQPAQVDWFNAWYPIAFEVRIEHIADTTHQGMQY